MVGKTVADSILITSDDPVVGNHRLHGQSLFPGLAYIDLIVQLFVEDGIPLDRIAIRSLSLFNPMIVAEGRDVRLAVERHAIGPSRWKVDIHGRDAQSGTHYISAEVDCSQTTQPGDPVDVAAIKAAASRVYDLDECYARCRALGLDHTGFMKAEGRVYESADHILLELALGAGAQGSAGDFVCHPVLIDASAIGSAGLFVSPMHVAAAGAEQLLLPICYDGFKATSELRSSAYALIERSSQVRLKELTRQTIAFLDRQGRHVAVLEGYVNKLVRGGRLDHGGAPAEEPRAVEAPTNASPAPAGASIKDRLRALFAAHLQRPIAAIKGDIGYYDMGFDSRGLLSLMVKIGEMVGRSLPPTLLFEHTTLDELAEHLSTFGAPVAVASPANDRAPVAASPHESRDGAIAVIGLAGRYPESASVDELWENLKAGKDCIREIPSDRWDAAALAGVCSPSGKPMSRWGGFVADVDRFDPLFFNISPGEAERMDPQERLFLQTCWEAIEDAGYTPKTLVTPRGPQRRHAVGVFVGVMHNDYALLGWESLRKDQPFALAINQAPLANRVSYTLNFHGPSLVVDTVCSSSLTALHLAIASLRRGESEVAIAGGVNLSLHPSKYLTYGLMDMHATDGRCRSFGKGGDGYVSGEGVGAVILKPLERAVADGDRIYAVLRGSAINHGGKVSGFTVPSPVAHADMIVECLETSGVDPRSISYVEAHGTGTSLGDPIELQGLVKAFERFTSDRQFCAIGSVKSNIGHAESAAGISGLTKVLLQLHHRQWVPSLHAAEENPHIDFTQTPFRLQRVAEPWPEPAPENGGPGRRRAALSSFGAYGSNAHVIVEEHRAKEAEPAVRDQGPAVIVLSARSADRLVAQAQRLARFLGSEHPALADLAYTLQVGREAMEARAGFVVSSIAELRERLARFIDGERETGAEHGEHHALLGTWLRGEAVDWRPLHAGRSPKRLRLPTYPFARDRYWIPEANPRADEAPATDAVTLIPRWEDRAARPLSAAARASHHDVVFLDAPEHAAACEALAARAGERITSTVITTESDDPASRFGAYCRRLLEKIQGDARQRRKGRSLLQVVSTHAADAWIARGVGGLLRTAHLEDPRMAVQLVLMDDGATPAETWRALSENRGEASGVVRYRDGRRAILGWHEDATASSPRAPWRRGGVYLITGGAGGLGRIVAADIARGAADAVVVLTGRSPIDPARETELRALNANGSRIRYQQLDVTDGAATARLVGRIVAEHGALHGVIHAAGAHRDAFLVKKTWDEFGQILAPKVSGAIHLDRATKDLDLDFFVLFASIAGALGNVGQVDYAAANAFMDGFAEHRASLVALGRRRGKTVSIDWPLWQDGGMQVDAATRETMRDTLGMVPMETARGLRALHRAIGGQATQLLVIDGERDAILRAVAPPPEEDEAPVAPDEGSKREIEAKVKMTGTEPLHERVSAQLKKVIGQALKLPAAQVDSDAPWERYGIDSLIVTKLNRELGAAFGDLPKTLFFEFQTIDALAAYFVDEHRERAQTWCGLGAAPVAPVAPSAPRAPAKPRVAPERMAAASSGDEPIAIIGISGRYPHAPDLETFWANLAAGRDCIDEIPADRWSLDGFYHPTADDAIAHGGSYGKWGGFLEGFAQFDPVFFGITPKEVMAIDPQERLFLQAAWEAIEDAAYTRERIQSRHRGRVGVFAGITKAGFNLCGPDLRQEGQLLYPKTSFSSVANRVSYFLNLSGPSMPIDTMCSSSLTAIHEARESLRRGACEMAIAGGVNLYLHPSTYAELSALRMLSVDGKCRSFGAGGNGFVPGEGVGAVLLKPLSAALRDGDRIHALIVSTHINHGGKTNGYTVPSPQAQADVVREALHAAGIDARTISYVEAHGTGTELGDPIEVRGLTQAFGAFTKDRQFCALGSA
jgi:acyl transferase domain-containing protein/acyl carrier protein